MFTIELKCDLCACIADFIVIILMIIQLVFILKQIKSSTKSTNDGIGKIKGIAEDIKKHITEVDTLKAIRKVVDRVDDQITDLLECLKSIDNTLIEKLVNGQYISSNHQLIENRILRNCKKIDLLSANYPDLQLKIKEFEKILMRYKQTPYLSFIKPTSDPTRIDTIHEWLNELAGLQTNIDDFLKK